MTSSIPNEYEAFLKRYIWRRDGTLTGSTTPGQSEPGSNGNKGVLQTPLNLSFTIRCSLVPSPGHLFFGEWRVLLLCRVAQLARGAEYTDCFSAEG